MFRFPAGSDISIGLYEHRHAAVLFQLVDANRGHLARWFPWVTGVRTVDDSAAFIRRGLERFARNEGFEAGIWHRDELAGSLAVHAVDRSVGRCEIGYWLATDAQGKGIVTRAVERLLDELFGPQGMERVEIRAQPDNLRSRAVAERLGFILEGQLRSVVLAGDGHTRADLVVYGLLRGEWQGRATGRRPVGSGAETQERA